MKRGLMVTGFSVFALLIIPALVLGQENYQVINGEKVFQSISNGLKFYHFRFKLSPENTVLPTDEKILRGGYKRKAENYRMEINDEESEAFKYGMFSIFIPVVQFPFTDLKDGFIILRMPQTFAWKYPQSELQKVEGYVRKKQNLYHQIKKMVENQKGSVEVVVELPRIGNKLGEVRRNVYFRNGGGAYINYVGQYNEAIGAGTK